MARGMTIPAEAPTAANARNAASHWIEGARAQPRQASVYIDVATINGRLRPNRSERVPWVNWPTDRPANQAARVSCAEPGGAPNECSSAGKAGRYISVVAGPTAVRKPSRMGSQAGNVIVRLLQGAVQMASGADVRHCAGSGLRVGD